MFTPANILNMFNILASPACVKSLEIATRSNLMGSVCRRPMHPDAAQFLRPAKLVAGPNTVIVAPAARLREIWRCLSDVYRLYVRPYAEQTG